MKPFKLILPSLLGIAALGWGGAVPETSVQWGWDDGNTDIVPSSHDRYYWYIYNNAVDDQTWDRAFSAVASIDRELPTVRWVPGRPSDIYDDNEVLVSISIKNDAVPPECSDTEEGTSCELGRTDCLSKVNNFVPGLYDGCKHYRVSLYWARIVANTAARHPGDDPLEVLYKVTRHELTHSMGFRHGTGGPMENGSLPLTECQSGILSSYRSEVSETGWLVQTPSACE
jgi:hypothetical protein